MTKKKSNVQRLLEKALQLLTKKGWTKGYYAKTASGEDCHWRDERAVRFCIVGALGKARDDLKLARQVEVNAEDLLQREADGVFIVILNDAPSTRKVTITSLLKRAIKRIEEEA